jgi:hypothetical protein
MLSEDFVAIGKLKRLVESTLCWLRVVGALVTVRSWWSEGWLLVEQI